MLLISSLAFAAQGQITRYGVRGGIGVGYIDDDLFFNSPILSADVGGFMNIGFLREKKFWRNNFTLQLGINATRRGSKFYMNFNSILARREGKYQGYYLQLPLLAAWRSELPFDTDMRQYLNFSLGPTFNVGVLGRLQDRMNSIAHASPLVNFNNDYTAASGLFDHVSRLDLGMQLGIGYELDNYTFDVIWDLGLINLRNVDEMLINLDVVPGEKAKDAQATYPHNPTGRTGQLRSFSFCVGYLIPNKPHRKSIKNPFE